MTDQVLAPGTAAVVAEERMPRGIRSSRGGATATRVAWGVAGVAAVVAVWELYKLLGPADGVTVGGDGSAGSGVILLPRTHDRAMPHVGDMIARMFAPTSGGDTPPLIVSVAGAAGMTLGLAALGWILGVIVGSLLGIAMQRWRLVEAGLLPWIVVSQIVPLIAFAPVVNAIVLYAKTGPQACREVKRQLRWARHVAAEAAPLDKETQARLQALLCPGSPMVQLWAMMDATCVMSYIWHPEMDNTGSVGRMVPNLDIKIVDDAGQPKIEVDYLGEKKQFSAQEISSMVLLKVRHSRLQTQGPCHEPLLAPAARCTCP